MGCLQAQQLPESLANTLYSIENCTDYLNCRNVTRLNDILTDYSKWEYKLSSDHDVANHDAAKEKESKQEHDTYTLVSLLNDYHHIMFAHEWEEVCNYFCDINICDTMTCNMVLRNHRDRSNKDTQSRTQLYHQFGRRRNNDNQYDAICDVDDCEYDDADTIPQNQLNLNLLSDTDKEHIAKYHKKLHRRLQNDVIQQQPLKHESTTIHTETSKIRANGKSQNAAIEQQDKIRREWNVGSACSIFSKLMSESGTTKVITQQILDQIHCYIYHTFDMGFKLKIQQIENDEKWNENNEEKKDGILNEEINAKDYRKQEQIGRIMRTKKEYIGNRSDGVNVKRYKQDNMYSFGIKYYYDDKKYENNYNLDIEHNVGYTYSDWFIKKKYENLKAEILGNKICTIDKQQYKDTYYKAKIYLKTEHVVRNYQNILIENLLVVMIYCNFDVIQAEFTRTYRHRMDETDDELKLRHSEYANFGKWLENSVEVNGISVENGKTKIFYHGTNMELMFTSLLHKYFGPLSTSSEYEVALLFTNNDGMVIELQDGTLLSNEQKAIYFDCEWISDFGYEREKLFIGGQQPLKIVSVFHVGLNQNCKVYIKLITILSGIIKDDISLNDGDALTERNQKAIVKLLKHESKEKIIESIPKYINRLLHLICSDVKNVMTRYNLTFGNDRNVEKYKILSAFLCHTDCQLFKLELLCKIFPNLSSIAIEGNSLTFKVFDKILQFIRNNESHDNMEEELPSNKLNNLVFKSPISPSIAFKTIQKNYGQLFAKLNWTINHREKLLIISKRKARQHDRTVSTNLLNTELIFNQSENFLLNSSLDLFEED